MSAQSDKTSIFFTPCDVSDQIGVMTLLFKRMISNVNSSQTKTKEGKGRTLVCFASSSGDQRRRKIGQTKTWPEIGPGATALL